MGREVRELDVGKAFGRVTLLDSVLGPKIQLGNDRERATSIDDEDYDNERGLPALVLNFS